MKAMMLTGLRQMEVGEVEDPKICNRDEVLLKITAVGICGSDVHYFETGRIGSQVVQFPYIVGHECSGIVAEVGADVKNVAIGDEVVVDPLIACGACDQCLGGRENTCRNQKFLGCPGQVPGCLCEYIVMPAKCCFPTQGKITPAQGVMCEPFAIGIYAVQQAGLRPDMKIGILGAGPIGLCTLEAAKAEGISTAYMTEILPERMAIAKQAGAVWVGSPNTENVVYTVTEKEPLGLDVVFEAAGQQETIDQAIEMLKPGGKLIVIGIPREDRISFRPDHVRRKEISIIHVRRQNECTQKAMDLVASAKVDLDYQVTHRFSFDQTPEAFELVANYREGVVKAVIDFIL